MLTLNDGRNELWQWDTGRTLSVDAECSQVHFSNKVFGRSIDVDVVGGVVDIPDILLQTDKDLNAWAFVGTAENGYTKISKTFKVNRRNKPADYVFTPPDQTSLEEIKEKVEYLESVQDPDAIKNAVEDYLEQNPVEVPVQSVNGKTGAVELTANDVGAISQDDLQEATNNALAQAKASGEFDGADGQPGENGADGYSPTANVTQNDNGATITITDKNGTTTATVTNGKDGADGTNGKDGADGKDGAPGADGQDGMTPAIGDNGNWYLGDTDTGKPSRGETGEQGPAGADGAPGADGKSAYQYAQDGGYHGTEDEFAAKLAEEYIQAPVAAEVGQTIVVKAVDENGKPTEWEAADVGGWDLITDITLTEDGGGATQLNVTRNDKGEDFEYRQCMVCLSGAVIDGWPSGAFQYIDLLKNNDMTGSSASVLLSRLSPGAGGTGYKTTVEISIFGNLVRTIACGGSADTSSLIIRGETSIDTFRSIKLYCYGNNQWTGAFLAAGGRVVIYGRK